MPADVKDPLLESALGAEAKLRRLIKGRQTGADVVQEPAQPACNDGTDQTESNADDLIALTEPDGSVHWALRFIPDAVLPARLPDEEPALHPSVVDGLARAIPQVAQALQRGQVFELIGPGAALEGLRNGTLEMIPAKAGGLLGGVRAPGTVKLAHQARFRPVKLARAMGPGLAMTAASAVLGHMHMVEIRKQLARIEGKVDRVLEGQQAERHGRLSGTVEVLQDVARSMGASGATSPLQLQRLIAAELDLRQVTGELEQIHRWYAGETESLHDATLAKFVAAFGTTRRIEIDDARLYVAAVSALVLLERLLLECAIASEPVTVPAREMALRATCERLEGVDAMLGHLGKFHTYCRRAMDEESARALRLSTGDSEAVSMELHKERLTVAELLSAARRMALRAGTGTQGDIHVVRVDARGGAVQAQVALIDAG